MYSCESVHKNKIALSISFILTVVAFGAIFFVGANPIAYASIIQLVAVMLLTVAIYLLTSFTLKRYTYKIDFRVGDGDTVSDGYDFYIIENKGKRNITLVRIDLKFLRAVTAETKENRKALRDEVKSKGELAKFYTYCPDMYPNNAIWAYFDGVCDGVNGDIAIRFCPDDKLKEILEGFLKEE